MKKILPLTALLAFCLSLSSVFSLDRKVIVAGDQDKEGGDLAEITLEAFHRVGYVADFRFVPWARALELSINGSYTVLMGALYTEEWAESLTYSEPISETHIVLLKRRDLNFTYETVQDLKPFRIGAIRGAKVNEFFDADVQNSLSIEYVSNAEQNIRKLLAGRVDLIVGREEQIDELLTWEFREEAQLLEKVDPPLQINYIYNCVTKANPDHQKIIDDFNIGMKILRDEGSLDWIKLKHGGRS